MTNDYKWENPNSKIVEYGGPALGGVLIWLSLLFYPAVIIAMQFGMTFYTSYNEALFPSFFVGLVVLGLIWVLLQIPMPICRILLISLYVLCLPPFVQYVSHVSNAEYLESWEYEARLEELGIEWDPCVSYDDWPKQEPFPGFNWFWFIPSSDNELWNWGLLGEAVWDWFKMALLIAVITYSICGVIILFSWMKEK